MENSLMHEMDHGPEELAFSIKNLIDERENWVAAALEELEQGVPYSDKDREYARSILAEIYRIQKRNPRRW